MKTLQEQRTESVLKMQEHITELEKENAKAKEIIKTFLAIVNNDVEYVQNPQDCKDLWKELCEKAEQFIKDYEVFDIRHEVEIKQKPSGKKSVTEKIICELIDLKE